MGEEKMEHTLKKCYLEVTHITPAPLPQEAVKCSHQVAAMCHPKLGVIFKKRGDY